MNYYAEYAQELLNHIKETQKAQQKEFFEDARNLLERMIKSPSFNTMTYAEGRYNQLIDSALLYKTISINTWSILYRKGSKVSKYCIDRGFEND